METRRDIFQAIADPTRRSIVLLLAASAMTPSSLADRFNISRQAVSKHLQILTECELILPKPYGREVYYHLCAGKMEEMENWLTGFKAILSKRFEQLDQVLEVLKSAE